MVYPFYKFLHLPSRAKQIMLDQSLKKILGKSSPQGCGFENQSFHLMTTSASHLCFKQAQPKMCHSPKVDDGVDIKKNWNTHFGHFFKRTLNCHHT